VIKELRDKENEVMKDVPGWVTGTWYGEPVYFTMGDKWWDPTQFEFFAHSAEHPLLREFLWRHHSEYAGPKWYDEYIEKYLPRWFKLHIW
jgi:hypothetical protein